MPNIPSAKAMTLAQRLAQAIAGGIHRIGQIEIRTALAGHAYVLAHAGDADLMERDAFGGLTPHAGPAAARELGLYGDDGSYRFVKAQTNLIRGWVLTLESIDELRLALDYFYPAALGVWIAQQDETLEVQNLRDKLARQTGMYRHAAGISDAGAQKLVREVCGPAHQCAKRILWQLDEHTRLEDSVASRYNGIPGDVPAAEAIPLLCREACNHMVAQCRLVAKDEKLDRA